NDYDLMYVNLENEIEPPAPGTEEAASCDCQREHTKWDKVFIMLENSQMKENMMLQALDELPKVDLQTLRAEVTQLTTNLAGTWAATLDKVTSHVVSQVEQVLVKTRDQAEEAKRLQESEQGKVLEHVLQLSHNILVISEVFSNLNDLKCPNCACTKSPVSIYLTLFLTSPGCETAILFPMRSKKIFGSVHPTAGMALLAFTACVWVKVTEALDKTIVFSYGTRFNPYEIQLYLSRRSVVLLVRGDQHKVTAQNVIVPGEWIHLCGTWSSENGSAALWVQGELRASSLDVASGHGVPDGGILQIGQEKNGCCVGGGFDEALAFSGKLTGFNLWDRVLSSPEITAQGGEGSCGTRGNVVGWGVTEVLPYGGAQYVS
ncbi:PTX3 protein, partial [Campylorhamphus procurvoides]|nr:PTX3 protein [Campylorhamphus procurvoides]